MVFTPSHEHLARRYDGRSPEYRAWRAQRLRLAAARIARPPLAAALPPGPDVTIDTPVRRALVEQIENVGFAQYYWHYRTTNERQAVADLAQQLGLDAADTDTIQGDDHLSLLRDLSGTPQARFIPYSARPMNWHTDGYYNAADAAVRSFILHCLEPAASGGTLTLLDPELLLIALHDDDSQLVEELSRHDAMYLPSNRDAEGHDRPNRWVPVFYTHSDGALGMRFTARSQHIQWKNERVKAAAQYALDLMNTRDELTMTIHLTAGEGLIARNVLHRRSGFENAAHSAGRQVLRGRYLQCPQVMENPNAHAACE